MKSPRVGLSLMPEEGFRAAASPLFEEGLVDVVEWTFDIAWSPGFQMPEWADAVLDLYANAGCLFGHGFGFSALSGTWEKRQDAWLEFLARELKRRSYLHVTEHFGFMSAPGFFPSAPFPVPMTDGSIRVGREALGRLTDVLGEPAGLENLAPTLSARDAEDQGEFLDALLAPSDGFLILDLHNVYCQSKCLGIPIVSLIERFPLDRVREIHVSGGSSWSPPLDADRPLWTDTHDGPIPSPVFDVVPFALAACKNVEAVIFERFYGSLEQEEDRAGFQQDFKDLRQKVEACHG